MSANGRSDSDEPPIGELARMAAEKARARAAQTEAKLLEGHPAKLRDVLEAAREIAAAGEAPALKRLVARTGYPGELVLRHEATLKSMGIWPTAVGAPAPVALAAPAPPAPSSVGPLGACPECGTPYGMRRRCYTCQPARPVPVPVPVPSAVPAEDDPMAAEFAAMRLLAALEERVVRRVMAWAAAHFVEEDAR